MCKINKPKIVSHQNTSFKELPISINDLSKRNLMRKEEQKCMNWINHTRNTKACDGETELKGDNFCLSTPFFYLLH